MATASSSEEPRGYLLLTLNDVKVDRVSRSGCVLCYTCSWVDALSRKQLYEGQRMPIASGELR